MKKIILFISMFVCAQFVCGQIISLDKTIVISGKVIDIETGQPLEYATISLHRLGHTKIVGVATDSRGLFKLDIDAGIYKIRIDFLSYKTYELKSKLLTDDINLGVINLSSENTLDEVQVDANKKLVEYKINKKIYNASADIANRGGNALDVLGNTPSVRADLEEGALYVRGSIATILINGQPQFNIDNNLDFLKALPSNSIDKVEIIARSAKYSADGGGAILNIVTKKTKTSGIKGSFEAHTGLPENHGFSGFINKNTGKVNLFSTLSFNHQNNTKFTDIEQPLLGLSQDIEENNVRNTFLFHIGGDFYINDKSTLTSSFLINTNSKNNLHNIKETDYNRDIISSNDKSRIEGRLGYTVELDTLGQNLSVAFKYETTTSDTKDDILETPTLPTTTIIQQSNKDQHLDNLSAQIDYTLPFNEDKNIELGYRGTIRVYKNIYNVEQFDPISNDFATINNLDDIFNYDENVHAFYGLYNATHDNFSYSLGLRTEISKVTIKEKNNGFSTTKNYTDLFPSLTLAYEISDDSNISFNYSRSIDRPAIPQINPFISFALQRLQTIGNQNLNPYYTNYFELLFDKSFEKVTFATALFANYQKDQFLSVIQNTGESTMNGDEIFRRININSGDRNIIGIDVDMIYTPFKGLRLNGYVSPYRQEIANANDNIYNDINTVLYAEGNALVSLNNGLKLRVSHLYQSPVRYGPTSLKAIHFSNATISKDLFKGKGSIVFKAVDIFRTKRFLYESLEANTITNYNVFYDNQYSLSFTYRFNQQTKNSKNRSKDLSKDDLEDKQDKKM